MYTPIGNGGVMWEVETETFKEGIGEIDVCVICIGRISKVNHVHR
jgi:hypothetical protein